MGLFDGLSNILFGDAPEVPKYQQYSAPTPQYAPTKSGQQQTDQLGEVLKNRLAAYQRGGSTLDPAYRQAVLGDAQAVAGEAARTASQNIGEQFNNWGLLNSSATGYGLGKVQNQYQLAMQNAANYLTQQDLQGLNDLTGQSQNFQNQQNQVANNQLQAKQFGYAAGQQEHQQEYNGQLAGYNQKAQQRSNLMEGLFGLGKAAFLKGK